MDADEMTAMYRAVCRQSVTVRRYSGTPRAATDYVAMGNARTYSGKELAGGIVQGDQRIILIAADLVAAGLTLPLRSSDKVMPGDRELAIIGAPGERKALEGELIAYEVLGRG
jgi:hypothetical protein